MNIPSKTFKYGLCIDFETSGLLWSQSSKPSQALSCAMAVFDFNTFDIIEEKEIFIKHNPDKYQWTEEAAAVHGLTIDFLNENGLDEEVAANDILEFIADRFKDENKIIVLGHNPDFDIQFMNRLLNVINIGFQEYNNKNMAYTLLIDRVKLDTSMLGGILLGKFRSDEIFSMIGYEKRGYHSALEDVRMTVGTCKALKEIFNIGLSSL